MGVRCANSDTGKATVDHSTHKNTCWNLSWTHTCATWALMPYGTTLANGVRGQGINVPHLRYIQTASEKILAVFSSIAHGSDLLNKYLHSSFLSGFIFPNSYCWFLRISGSVFWGGRGGGSQVTQQRWSQLGESARFISFLNTSGPPLVQDRNPALPRGAWRSSIISTHKWNKKEGRASMEPGPGYISWCTFKWCKV